MPDPAAGRLAAWLPIPLRRRRVLSLAGIRPTLHDHVRGLAARRQDNGPIVGRLVAAGLRPFF